jgi:hypothetical protein
MPKPPPKDGKKWVKFRLSDSTHKLLKKYATDVGAHMTEEVEAIILAGIKSLSERKGGRK